jgi:hypothetical protein
MSEHNQAAQLAKLSETVEAPTTSRFGQVVASPATLDRKEQRQAVAAQSTSLSSGVAKTNKRFTRQLSGNPSPLNNAEAIISKNTRAASRCAQTKSETNQMGGSPMSVPCRHGITHP